MREAVPQSAQEVLNSFRRIAVPFNVVGTKCQSETGALARATGSNGTERQEQTVPKRDGTQARSNSEAAAIAA
jgi:hypothetical protein